MRRRSNRALVVVLGALLTITAVTPAPASVDYAFLVDNTGTMRYGDRGAMTLVALSRFVDMMEPGDRVSVFSYGEVARPVLSSYPVEIHDDLTKTTVRGQLAFDFSADRTDITAGVDLVWREREHVFPRHCNGSGEALLVLLTDGKLVPVYDDYSKYEGIYRESRTRLRELARAFGAEGIPIYAVGVGSSEKIDAKHLASISEWSGGASYHVTSAQKLPDIYAGIWEDTRPDVIVESDQTRPSETRGFQIVESAAAGERAPTPRGSVVSSRSAVLHPFDLAYRASTGAVALFLGLVVVGARRRQPWAEFFTRALGPQEQRVRGYLKPVDLPGTQMARAIIGIENPGVPTLEIGHGTPYAGYAKHTVIEFVGTRDGKPPTMRVPKGEVTVDGELVTDEWPLRDGQIVCIEGVQYMYLRGSRR
jgi:hypothetical protein